ncbi:hypothetical protein PFNF135_05949 [Plasmodium falciparum NF135/5.C10]|uniref:Uncharacterized protein n=1 Tax=Plasmodium falciparum NF135/5.C10 TaxID=1036726 RepID=W4I889_PLAFA|nr:hypothetical protein PFNF135_05949 [Plasmodium falciparum NF135/5.C10]
MLICNDGIILYVRSKCYISTRTFNRISYNKNDLKRKKKKKIIVKGKQKSIQNFKTFSLCYLTNCNYL